MFCKLLNIAQEGNTEPWLEPRSICLAKPIWWVCDFFILFKFLKCPFCIHNIFLTFGFFFIFFHLFLFLYCSSMISFSTMQLSTNIVCNLPSFGVCCSFVCHLIRTTFLQIFLDLAQGLCETNHNGACNSCVWKSFPDIDRSTCPASFIKQGDRREEEQRQVCKRAAGRE